MMDCKQVEEVFLKGLVEATSESRRAGAAELPAESRAALEAHLAICASCRRIADGERALDAALEHTLPRYGAPVDLRRRLHRANLPVAPASGPAPALEAAAPAAPAPAVTGPSTGGAPANAVLDRAFIRASLREPTPGPVLGARPRARAVLAGASAGAAVAAVVLVVGWATVTGGRRPGVDVLGEAVGEAVNDHLRVVASTHPVEIEGGGIHQVRPWFTGRLDFAPPVTFSGDADFPLVGGSVGYFHEHKAAVFSFRRRLHAITLLVLPDAGLDWPQRDLVRVGPLSVAVRDARGFTVLLWRDHGFGYVLVSDVNRTELERLATLIDTAPRD